MAKQRLQTAYDGANDQQKAIIDEGIKQHFGSREKYDTMEYCIYKQVSNVLWIYEQVLLFCTGLGRAQRSRNLPKLPIIS